MLMLALMLIGKNSKYSIFILSLLFVVLNKSFTSVIFLFFVILFFLKNKINIYRVAVVFSLLLLLVVVSGDRIKDQYSRVFSVLVQDEIIISPGFLSDVGSRRLTQTYYGFVLSDSFSGVGIGNSEESFIGNAVGYAPELRNISNIYDREVSPTSYLAQLSYEIGLFNAFIFLLILFVYPLYIVKPNYFIFLFGFFQLFVFSTTTFITPWIFLALSFRYGTRRSNHYRTSI